jgi:hypothetical protein
VCVVPEACVTSFHMVANQLPSELVKIVKEALLGNDDDDEDDDAHDDGHEAAADGEVEELIDRSRRLSVLKPATFADVFFSQVVRALHTTLRV